MKLKNAAVAFAAAALMTATAANAATNINISIGDPGYWGVIPALTGHAPRVWNSAPVVATCRIASVSTGPATAASTTPAAVRCILSATTGTAITMPRPTARPIPTECRRDRLKR